MSGEPEGVAAALPPGALPFERALAAGCDDTLPIPYREILSPSSAPAIWLPFLAAHRSVDLWFDDWTEARKRAVVEAAILDARLKGTRSGTTRFLAYVDATLVDTVAYPARFVLGRAVVGRTPIAHGPFLARHLVRVETWRSPRAFVIGRSALASRDQIEAAVPHLIVTSGGAVINGSVVETPSREPLRRCLAALRAVKAPETEIRVDFGHHRRLTLADAPPLDGSTRLGAFVARTHL